MRDEIDDILRNRLHDVEIHEGLPSWERIEGSIEEIESTKKKKFLFLINNIYGKAAVVIILIGLGFGGYYIGQDKTFNNDQSLSDINYNQNISEPKSDSKIILDNNAFEKKLIEEVFELTDEASNSLLISANNQIKDNNSLSYVLNSLEGADNSNEGDKNDNISNKPIINETGLELNFAPTLGSFLDHPMDLITQEEKYYDIDKYLTDFNLIYGIGDQIENKWSTAIFANILTMISEHNSSNIDGNTQKMVLYDYVGEKFNDKNRELLLVDRLLVKKYLSNLPVFADESDYEKLTHNFPLTIKIGFSRMLNEGVGLESGLEYTFMNSNTGSMSRSSIFYNQNLHYLGIPLSIYYSFLPTNSSWVIDLRHGVLTEKLISIRCTTSVFQDYNIIESTEYNEVPSSLMLSTNLGLGFGYKLFKDFGIYMEPSMAYYFYTKGQPISYKTDRPLSFNLKAGIRFNF